MTRVVWNGQAAIRAGQAGARSGLSAAGEHLLGVAREQVPLDEATLSRSGAVDASDSAATVSFDTPYAARQHEELTWRHTGGRKAKYLEDPAGSESDRMVRIVAEHIRRQL